jgi:hypothetical protein
MLACLGADMRVVNRRYFRLWHNHGGRLHLHIITGQVVCGFLISLKGFIPSVLRPNLIFLGSLEMSSSWLRSKYFHCLSSAGCRIFPSLYHWICQSKSWASLALENICFKQSMTGMYHITRAWTFLSLDPWFSWFGGPVFFLFHPFLLLLQESSSMLSFHLYQLALHPGHLSLNSCSFRYKMQWFRQAWIFSTPSVNGQMIFFAR